VSQLFNKRLDRDMYTKTPEICESCIRLVQCSVCRTKVKVCTLHLASVALRGKCCG